jgi:hypothetical protein
LPPISLQDQITPTVISYNAEPNIRRTLDKLGGKDLGH